MHDAIAGVRDNGDILVAALSFSEYLCRANIAWPPAGDIKALNISTSRLGYGRGLGHGRRDIYIAISIAVMQG